MPAIIKPSRVAVAHQTEPTRDGALTTVSAYVLFDFDEPGRLLTEQALWPMVADQMPNQAIFDRGQPKPNGELIIAGRALSPADEPVDAVRVTAQFGAFEKQLAVFGDRFWQRTDEGVRISRPVPFLEMPIGDQQAFGGPGYLPNQRGKGFAARQMLEAGLQAPLPNVEDANRLIKSHEDQPRPAFLGPIAPDDAARLQLLGTYDQHWVDNVSPLKPDDFNPLYNCDAPVDQRFDSFFEGGETFAISGMSRGEPSVGGQLPRLTARCFFQLERSEDLAETVMRCDTVTLFPNVRKATLTFRGLIRAQDRFAQDISAIMLALEETDAARRDPAYYVDVFRKRRSKTEAHKYALADYQLMPQADPRILSERRRRKLEKAAADREKFVANQNWATAKMLEDEGLPGDLFPPRDTQIMDDIPLVAQPTREEMENGDVDIAALLDEVKEVEDALLEKRDHEMVRAELQRRMLIEAIPSERVTPNMLKPIAEEALVEKYPDVQLDPEIVDSLKQVAAGLSSLNDRNETGAVSGSKHESDVGDSAARTLEMLFGPSGEPTADELESTFEKAVARALKQPEGNILADFRTALQETDFSALDTLETGDHEPPTDDGDQFSVLLAELTAPAGDPSAEAHSDANLLLAAPEQDGGSALKDASGLSQANRKRGEMVEALMRHGKSLEADGFPSAENQSADASTHSLMATTMERLNEADELLDENMAVARQNSPTPLFPLDALPEPVAGRLGAVIAEKMAEKHEFKGADLAGADLRNADFSGMDLRGTFFEQADLTGARFSGCDLSGAVFTGATLDGADLSRTDLSNANLSKVSAIGACLDGAKLHDLVIFQSDFSQSAGDDVTLEKVRFIEAKLDDVTLGASRLTDCQFLSGSAKRFAAPASRLLRSMFIILQMNAMDLSGCDLERIGFMEVPARKSNFRNGKWKSVGFMGACDLTGSRFDALEAAESSFNSAKMQACCFLRANGNACFFNACDLEANDFRLASFHNTLFGRSTFAGSDFFGANLFMAALTAADLRGCSMRGANLFAADLMDAKLEGCDLSGANLGMTMLGGTAHA
ncbi:DUF2169 domain-containing protein [uncultured Roseibium sp.]|uniref:DUF2169 family type VI secretion system accessory protein n=1 Tax=uncultured Roseibium sp. TaxID=1936171 RepID=UPI00261074B8|nr:DUF2169 domain-containing protein [uncultured Roseibium sp.]